MLVFVPLGRVEDSRYQPRRHYDPAAIEELAGSIEREGQLQHPAARLLGGDGQKIAVVAGTVHLAPHVYLVDRGHGADALFQIDGVHVELAFGHRRARAWRLVWERHAARADDQVVGAGCPGLDGVPVGTMPVELEPLTDLQMFARGVDENRYRRDISAVEEAEAMQMAERAFGWDQEETGRRFGYSRSTVAGKLRLLRLPETAQALNRAGRLSEQKCRQILRLFSLDVDTEAAAVQHDADVEASVNEYWTRAEIVEAAEEMESAAEIAQHVDEWLAAVRDVAEQARREREPGFFDGEFDGEGDAANEATTESPADSLSAEAARLHRVLDTHAEHVANLQRRHVVEEIRAAVQALVRRDIADLSQAALRLADAGVSAEVAALHDRAAAEIDRYRGILAGDVAIETDGGEVFLSAPRPATDVAPAAPAAVTTADVSVEMNRLLEIYFTSDSWRTGTTQPHQVSPAVIEGTVRKIRDGLRGARALVARMAEAGEDAADKRNARFSPAELVGMFEAELETYEPCLSLAEAPAEATAADLPATVPYQYGGSKLGQRGGLLVHVEPLERVEHDGHTFYLASSVSLVRDDGSLAQGGGLSVVDGETGVSWGGSGGGQTKAVRRYVLDSFRERWDEQGGVAKPYVQDPYGTGHVSDWTTWPEMPAGVTMLTADLPAPAALVAPEEASAWPVPSLDEPYLWEDKPRFPEVHERAGKQLLKEDLYAIVTRYDLPVAKRYGMEPPMLHDYKEDLVRAARRVVQARANARCAYAMTAAQVEAFAGWAADRLVTVTKKDYDYGVRDDARNRFDFGNQEMACAGWNVLNELAKLETSGAITDPSAWARVREAEHRRAAVFVYHLFLATSPAEVGAVEAPAAVAVATPAPPADTAETVTPDDEPAQSQAWEAPEGWRTWEAPAVLNKAERKLLRRVTFADRIVLDGKTITVTPSPIMVRRSDRGARRKLLDFGFVVDTGAGIALPADKGYAASLAVTIEGLLRKAEDARRVLRHKGEKRKAELRNEAVRLEGEANGLLGRYAEQASPDEVAWMCERLGIEPPVPGYGGDEPVDDSRTDVDDVATQETVLEAAPAVPVDESTDAAAALVHPAPTAVPYPKGFPMVPRLDAAGLASLGALLGDVEAKGGPRLWLEYAIAHYEGVGRSHGRRIADALAALDGQDAPTSAETDRTLYESGSDDDITKHPVTTEAAPFAPGGFVRVDVDAERLIAAPEAWGLGPFIGMAWNDAVFCTNGSAIPTTPPADPEREMPSGKPGVRPGLRVAVAMTPEVAAHYREKGHPRRVTVLLRTEVDDLQPEAMSAQTAPALTAEQRLEALAAGDVDVLRDMSDGTLQIAVGRAFSDDWPSHIDEAIQQEQKRRTEEFDAPAARQAGDGSTGPAAEIAPEVAEA